MTYQLLLILLFGSMVGAFMVAGMLSLQGKDLFGLEEAEEGPTPQVSPPMNGAAAKRLELIGEIERRLRHDITVARTFVENPSPQTLWP